MNIKYLGTAAEAIPAVFCECDTCVKAKSLVEETCGHVARQL